ncbi:hypothetical protein F6R98_17070 [Candidatus Methylospira mobilis]|uniref:Uncharacterized protein n=1 Tax=Candidatus Methylospira mobilis TaxID=1808979 RepID=A0A5Q0BLW4_9GAMM|nr:hypothetical protein [Candidatus Methylospira mobilis]QFY44132.1 hypothetical protein F6R98_17070 [Candidatus Methylospira mobilis]WNV06452.1 hypothetical protein RP726_08610 [Candidatus Methylospira mobilis]
MMRYFKNIMDGMRQVLVMYPGSDYVRPTRKGFLIDNANLRGDATRVANALRDNIKQYDGEAYYRKHARTR